MTISRVLRSLFAVAVLTAVSGTALATAPYDPNGATVELVPAAGGAALASTRITFPPDAITTTLTIPSATIDALAAGGSINLLARVTSDALTAGSTCTANVLSRAFTFTRAAAVKPTATVPTLGVFGLVLLAGLVGAVAWRSRRDARLLNVVLPAMLLIGFALVSVPTLNAQATDPNTTYASSASAGVQAVRAVVDAGGVVTVTVTRATTCAASPITLVSESLPNLEVAGGTFSGTLSVSRAIPAGTTITAEYLDTAVGNPLTFSLPQYLTVTANGTTTLQVSGRTSPGWTGKFVRLRVVVEGSTLLTAIIEMF